MSYTFKDNTDEVPSAQEKAIENGLTAIGMTAEGHAKRKINDYPAVDTGRLRNSITFAISGEKANTSEDIPTKNRLFELYSVVTHRRVRTQTRG